MKTKLLSLAALALALSMMSACALAATANASIVAPKTVKITAPFSGTLLPFDHIPGDSVAAGDVLFTLDATPIYATQSGTVADVYAAVGDDASGVLARYGGLAAITPENAFYLAASTGTAPEDKENRTLYVGETLYLKSGDVKGTGRVVSVSGGQYVVEVLSGNYELGDTVRCYRDTTYESDANTGRGTATRYTDTYVAGSGRIAAVHVKKGDKVSVGDVLFEVVDAQSAPGASRTMTAPIAGAIASLNTISGAQVYRGQLLCEITDLSALELSAQIDELDVSRIRVGNTLSYTLDAYAGETFTGTVTQIRPIGTKMQNATYFDVRITLPAGRTLLPGMNGTVVLN